ncbi:MAG: hypothetical protein Q9220_006273 [cf. Caloplaca sp. 1 TL-2023]
MARNAANFLSNDPIDPDIQKIYDLLFTEDKKSTVLCREAVLQYVQNYATMHDDKTNAQEIIIYCDFSRYVTRADGRVYDPDIDSVEKTAGDFDKTAKEKCDDGLAFVVNPISARIQQIQICPWYVKYMAAAKFKTTKLATLKTGWKKITDKRWRSGKQSQMDALMLLDGTLLHEMTHTRDAGKTKDVGGADKAYGERKSGAKV